MKSSLLGFVVIFALLILGQGCGKESQWLGLVLPTNFGPTQQTFLGAGEKTTKEKFELGRKLFYDPILSRDSTISCGSCHIQGSAFTHHGHDLSHGIDDRLGSRNAPSIQNLLWQPTFFWDGGVHNLDLIPLAPIENVNEMDEQFNQVLSKLRRSKTYSTLFKKAFGSEIITSANMLKAMAEFQAMLISNQSKYDDYLANKTTLTADETAGLALFNQKCATCHSGVLFSDFKFRNNGTHQFSYSDYGRFNISLLDSDKYKFKTPSLRNVEKTAPYMHNGSINTLRQVLDYYSEGIQASTPSAYLDPSLNRGIPLSEIEKTQIETFLKTLTDNQFCRSTLFAEQ
jgi:cytochrome c peroxidase